MPLNPPSSPLRCGRFLLDYQTRPLLMGILNLTPDSFSDGGRFNEISKALAQAEQQVKEGVDILDLGAESSRPGAQAIDAKEEWRRLAPVLKEVCQWRLPISVDSYRPLTMQRALDCGADMINDIYGFRSPEARQAVAASHAALCVMHMQNHPADMQQKVSYQAVEQEVADFLSTQTAALMASGVAANRLCIDPGFGFGKLTPHNLRLLRDLAQLKATPALHGLPLLVGWSRKSSLGEITGRPVTERLPASLGAALIAIQNGANIVRVHDVAATKDIVQLWQALSAPTHF